MLPQLSINTENVSHEKASQYLQPTATTSGAILNFLIIKYDEW